MYYQYFNNKISKNILTSLLIIFTQFYIPYLCFAEEKPPSTNPTTSEPQKTPPNNDSNSQNKPATNNNQETPPKKEQSPQSQPQSQSQPQPPQPTEPTVEPPAQPPPVQTENPSVKSKKVPVKKKSTAVKKEETKKSEGEESNKEENKISLPEVLPDDISPLNNVSPTYGNEEQGNNFVKGVIAWVLIAIGIAIILFVILSNRKIPKDSESLFQGKHDLKTKLKNARSYNKNIRRK